jgi:hypothetical protein
MAEVASSTPRLCPRRPRLVNVRTGKCLIIAGGQSRCGDKGAALRSSLAAMRE